MSIENLRLRSQREEALHMAKSKYSKQYGSKLSLTLEALREKEERYSMQIEDLGHRIKLLENDCEIADSQYSTQNTYLQLLNSQSQYQSSLKSQINEAALLLNTSRNYFKSSKASHNIMVTPYSE